MQTRFLKLSLSLAILTLAGCQTIPYQGQARDVKRQPRVGGSIAVPIDPRPEDRARAEEKMKTNCAPNPFLIETEEEVAIGEKTDSDRSDTYRANNQRKVGNLFGVPLVSGDPGGTDSRSSSTKMTIKEWVMGYKCETPTKAGVRAKL